MRSLAALSVTAGIALAPALAAAPPAWSSEKATAHLSAPQACPSEIIYTVKKKTSVNYWVPGTNFVDGRGGTVQGSVEKSFTKSASLSAGAEASVSGVFASVKAQVSATITKANTVTVGHSYSHNISRNKYGHIRYRVLGYKVLIYKQRQLGNCKLRFIDAFYGNFPTTREGWQYWETTRP